MAVCVGLCLTPFLSSVAAADEKADEPPPPLSLATLYHPEKKFDYDGDPITARWVETDEGQDRLLVQRDAGWMQVDLQTGAESDWPSARRLQEKLTALDGVEDKQAAAAANRVAGEIDRAVETRLVQIGDGLAVVAAKGAANWLTRDATSWNDPTLDPSGRWVGYTTQGDLFLRHIASGRSVRLTRDASETVLDGILDWTYQEEIFGRGNYRGFWFSHDGNWLAMLRVDISQIEPYVLTGATSERGTSLVRRYSKAGDPIPHATLMIWDLRNAENGTVPPARQLAQSTPQKERIITGVWWDPSELRLLYSVSDRLQTWRELRVVDQEFFAGTISGSRRLLREESPAWVEPPDAPQFLGDGSIVWTSEILSGYRRLYRISASGDVITPLSPQDFDVASSYVAADGLYALVTGDAEGGAVERHAYRIELGEQRAYQGTILKLTERSGWNSVDFSPSGEWMIVHHSTPTSPPEVYARPTNPGSGEASSAAEAQSDRSEAVEADPDVRIELGSQKLRLPGELVEPKLFRIQTGDGSSLPAMVIRPPKTGMRLPVVVETYGGPQAPVVSARWAGSRGLYRQLLARNGIATLVVDNRSSGGSGIADTWAIHRRLGEVELADLLEAVAWLKSQDWVAADRLAIRGWSFGGFMTLYAMTHSDAFKAGIAGGSVTDWREYDSFYTERYMGLPEENAAGYDRTSPVMAAGDLHGHVLMIHGELDDNVHPANTMRMVDALQKAGKPFDLMIYPGAAHGIHNPQQVWHMARLSHGFLLDQLANPAKPSSGP